MFMPLQFLLLYCTLLQYSLRIVVASHRPAILHELLAAHGIRKFADALRYLTHLPRAAQMLPHKAGRKDIHTATTQALMRRASSDLPLRQQPRP